MVGVLLGLDSTVWPVIAFTVGRLVLFFSSPKKSHWISAKRILMYLKRTRENIIMYRLEDDLDLLGFVDSDFVRDHVN